MPFHADFSLWIKYLSGIVWLYKHMLTRAEEKLRILFLPASQLYGLLLFTFLTKRVPQFF